jgi:HEAT repeat protein
VDFLLTTFNTSTNVEVRRWLAMSVLGEIDDRRIYDDLTNHLTDNEDEESYYVAIYLASRGNKTALATLNRHYFNYPVSSVEWAYAAGLLGKYRYTPATTNLVDSLNAASLNLAAAACNSLQEIFPDSPRDFKGPGEAEAYFRKRLGEARE